jgi:hypothetical protein
MSLACDVKNPETGNYARITTGYLEKYDERFFAYYTSEKADEAKRRVARWVLAPDLDSTWFTGPLLQVLWDRDISKRGDALFGKLRFLHHSIFDMPEDSSALAGQSDEGELGDPEENSEVDEDVGVEDDHPTSEKRKARFEMGDRIGKIRKALKSLQADYEPLNALHAIRLPSRIGRGGHDLYQDGQITNRTDSFEDHRNTARYLYRIYKSVVEFTEASAWRDINTDRTVHIGLKGVPLIVRFAEPILEETFNRWVQMAFQKKNRFKLWGNPIRLGPTKVHVYGADRHLWQPINIEFTSEGIVAILPSGTCGNTFHRLVANIQQYVSPKFEAWVGSEKFEDVVGEWPANAEVVNEDR